MSALKIIDLSVPIEQGPSGLVPLELTQIDHAQGADEMARIFECSKNDFPQGLGWAIDVVKMSTHSGTHVDAPWHYFPTSGGNRAKAIDEIPLTWFFHDGVVLDMRHKDRGTIISVDDIRQALQKIDYQLKPWDIVLIHTGADKLWGSADYFNAGCGMGRESTKYLLENGIKVMGIDAWSWDQPFWAIKEDFKRTGDSTAIWGAHRLGIEKEYCHIEKLANLDKLPRPLGFKVACFPIKVTHGSAGWSRVVAILDE